MTIAKYLRVSDEDMDLDGIVKHESNSIANQRVLLDDFIRNTPEFNEWKTAEFLDDGRTGTNFLRTGVQTLIKAAQGGEIQCIIVKDISRFGRNFIEVGDFLEQKFPAWGVRFISLGDIYDSEAKSTSINMALRGLMAQMYSQDISEKTRSAKDAASRSGKIVTSQPTYGYDIDATDRHKFVINTYEAAVVQKIYTLYEQGIKIAEIARTLNAKKITTPQESKREKGYSANWGRGNLWHSGTISTILKNEKYTGKWIYGKTRVTEIGRKRAYPVPKSEWIIVENAIPLIISQEQFNRVQKMFHVPSKKTPKATCKPNKINTTAESQGASSIEKLKVEKLALWEDFTNGIISQEHFQHKNNMLSASISQFSL